MDRHLIFDIGFHKGEDTRYYLSRGYHVIAVDAVEELLEAGGQEFADAVNKGQLTLCQGMVSSADSEAAPFYISHNSLWNSAHREIAERKGKESRKITVPAITLKTLMRTYGTPYYCKIDIEGNDILALRSLTGCEELPPYISVETECIGDNDDASLTTFTTLDALHDLGYTRFKLVDQSTLTVLGDEPFYTRGWSDLRSFYADNYRYGRELLGDEDNPFFHHFPGCSGPFGEDLLGTWRSYEDAKTLIAFHSKEERSLGHEVWSFWCDWHAGR